MGLLQRTIDNYGTADFSSIGGERPSKFYKELTTLFAVTDKELMFDKAWANNVNRRNEKFNTPYFDFIAPSGLLSASSGNGGSDGGGSDSGSFDMGPFGIIYNFSDSVRRNTFRTKAGKGTGKYGAFGMTFKRLYALLCDAYNGGVLFVDTYFERIFKTRPAYRRLMDICETIQNNIDTEMSERFESLPRKKDGTPDERFTAYKEFSKFRVWMDTAVRQGCDAAAKDIRHDIVVCLSNGKLPLRGIGGATVTAKTQKARAALGGMVHPNRLFYASGQLIHNLNIYVDIRGKAA